MKYSFELKTCTPVKKIWSLYENVNTWHLWDADLEEISLTNSEFKEGTTGSMKLLNQPPIDFILTSVTPEKSFTNKTFIQNYGEVYFMHELVPSSDQTIIKHSIEFKPFNRQSNIQDSMFVSKIFKTVPCSVFSLIEAANE